MENKLGRKNILEWSETVQKVTNEMYKQAFYEGYDAAKDETPDVEAMAHLLIERYPGDELSDLMMAIDRIYPHVPHKTVNQQRAELIRRAREFVEGLFIEGHGGVGKVVWGESGHTKVDFIVNEEKRTVVALLSLAYIDVKNRHKGIAKCMPGEVFNADIGKAIALARALEIDVPKEFMQAVQPSHYSVGQVVKRKDERFKNSRKYRVYRIGKGSTLTILRNNDYGESAICDTTTSLDYEDENIKALQVIDDTNAQYEVTT